MESLCIRLTRIYSDNPISRGTPQLLFLDVRQELPATHAMPKVTTQGRAGRMKPFILQDSR